MDANDAITNLFYKEKYLCHTSTELLVHGKSKNSNFLQNSILVALNHLYFFYSNQYPKYLTNQSSHNASR